MLHSSKFQKAAIYGDFLSSRGLMLSGSQSGAHAVCTYVHATTHAHANVIRMHVHVHAVRGYAWLPVYVNITMDIWRLSTREICDEFAIKNDAPVTCNHDNFFLFILGL